MKKTLTIIMLAIAALTCTAGEIVKIDNSVKLERTVAKPTDKATAYCNKDRDGKCYQIYQGAKSGYFYYKTAKSGKHAGEPVKRYLNKADREKINQLRNNGK